MRLIALIAVLFFINGSFSQESFIGKSVFLELAGNGGIGSINYEKNLEKIQKDKVQFVFRTGFSFYPGDQNTGTTLIFPQSFNALFGQKHFLELGLGESVTITTRGSFYMRAVVNVGYRYMAPDKRIFYRITYTPFISHIWDFQMSQWGGFSIGYQF